MRGMTLKRWQMHLLNNMVRTYLYLIYILELGEQKRLRLIEAIKEQLAKIVNYDDAVSS